LETLERLLEIYERIQTKIIIQFESMNGLFIHNTFVLILLLVLTVASSKEKSRPQGGILISTHLSA
jgi:hypothetical protein